MPSRPSTLFADVDRLGRDPDRIAPVGPVTKVREALRLIAFLACRLNSGPFRSCWLRPRGRPIIKHENSGR